MELLFHLEKKILPVYIYFSSGIQDNEAMCLKLATSFGKRNATLDSFPTNPFPILAPRDQEIGELYVVQDRRATDFEATKLWKGSSGDFNKWITIVYEHLTKPLTSPFSW